MFFFLLNWPTMHGPKSNPTFRVITRNVVENMILHEIFRVVSFFPATFHVISRKISFLRDSAKTALSRKVVCRPSCKLKIHNTPLLI